MLENLITIVSVLLGVAFFTFAERKVLATIQRRRGPNVVGFWGILQAFADGLKLLLKEVIIPVRANWIIFILSPCIAFVIALTIWAFIPYNSLNFLTNFDFSLLFIYAISSVGVYGIILSGWSSNSRYAFLGALRSAAQLISYEVSIGLIILPVALCAGSFNIVEIVNKQINTAWFAAPLLPAAVVFFISILAETNRAPFDLPEAEAEIVAGYNVEYSSMTFALFFLAEYSNMLWLSFIFALCFLGGWGSPALLFGDSTAWLILKAMIICFLIIKVRANYPRYRYDQLMNLGWKCFLPFAIGYFMFISAVCFL